MDINFVLNKLRKMTNIENLDYYKEDLQKLVECHNNNQFSLNSKFKLLSEQIVLKLDNLYERTIELLSYGKDSSSLEVNILRYGEIEGKRRFDEKNKKCSHSLENYIKKYGEIDGRIKFKEYSKSRCMSLEMCIKRHGNVEGPRVFRNFWDNTAFGTSKRAFKKRHGNEWEKYYNEFRNSIAQNNTLEGKILKYGEEEGSKKFKESNIKKSKSLNKDSYVQKLLDKGLSFDEIQVAISERWDNTSLNSFILRYGENEGIKKYNEYVKNLKLKNPLCLEYYENKNIPEEIAFEIISKIQYERNKKVSKFSKESLFYFDKLNEILTMKGFECKYKENEIGILLTKNEYNVYKKARMFFYDFFVPDINLIIEYNGVRFHDDIDYDSTINKKEQYLYSIEYNKDFYKKWLAEKRGYTVLILRSWKIKEDLIKMFNFLNFTEEEKCKFA